MGKRYRQWPESLWADVFWNKAAPPENWEDALASCLDVLKEEELHVLYGYYRDNKTGKNLVAEYGIQKSFGYVKSEIVRKLRRHPNADIMRFGREKWELAVQIVHKLDMQLSEVNEWHLRCDICSTLTLDRMKHLWKDVESLGDTQDRNARWEKGRDVLEKYNLRIYTLQGAILDNDREWAVKSAVTKMLNTPEKDAFLQKITPVLTKHIQLNAEAFLSAYAKGNASHMARALFGTSMYSVLQGAGLICAQEDNEGVHVAFCMESGEDPTRFILANGLIVLVEKNSEGKFDFNIWEPDEDGSVGNLYSGGIMPDHICSTEEAIIWVRLHYEKNNDPDNQGEGGKL